MPASAPSRRVRALRYSRGAQQGQRPPQASAPPGGAAPAAGKAAGQPELRPCHSGRAMTCPSATAPSSAGRCRRGPARGPCGVERAGPGSGCRAMATATADSPPRHFLPVGGGKGRERQRRPPETGEAEGPGPFPAPPLGRVGFTPARNPAVAGTGRSSWRELRGEALWPAGLRPGAELPPRCRPPG